MKIRKIKHTLTYGRITTVKTTRRDGWVTTTRWTRYCFHRI